MHLSAEQMRLPFPEQQAWISAVLYPSKSTDCLISKYLHVVAMGQATYFIFSVFHVLAFIFKQTLKQWNREKKMEEKGIDNLDKPENKSDIEGVVIN